MTDLHYLSATEVLHAFRTPRALAGRGRSRRSRPAPTQTEPTVNCLLERDHEDLRAAAKAAEDRYAGKGEPPRPLEGLPVVLKEEQPIAGRSLRFGSLLTEGLVADETHPVAERVYDAGALVHARTTTPEFSCAGFTHSDLWGVTRNPWNPDYTPGGSSGGSGRRPRGRYGVPGQRLRHRRLDPDPRVLQRCRRLQGAVRAGAGAAAVQPRRLLPRRGDGPHRGRHGAAPQRDPGPAPRRPRLAARRCPIPEDLGDVRGMRIALAVTLGDIPVEPEVEANTRAFAEALRSAGAKVEEVQVDLSLERMTEARPRALRLDHGPVHERGGGTRRPALHGLHALVPTFNWSRDKKYPMLSEPRPEYQGIILHETFGNFAFAIACRVLGLRDLGPALSPFNAFLVITGIETLPLRMQRHCDNALVVAEWLSKRSEVAWVSYPGLPGDKYHKLAKKYSPKGAGAVFTFGLKGGYDAGVRLVSNVKLFSHLANIGDTRSLIIHPASTTHRQLSDAQKVQAGAGSDVVRLSIGLEDPDDIIADLEHGLKAK